MVFEGFCSQPVLSPERQLRRPNRHPTAQRNYRLCLKCVSVSSVRHVGLEFGPWAVHQAAVAAGVRDDLEIVGGDVDGSVKRDRG